MMPDESSPGPRPGTRPSSGPGSHPGNRDLRELADPNRVLLWDLDGTIADTRQDIATGVREMLISFGLEPLPLPNVIRHVGRGVRVLVTRSLAEAGRPDADEAMIDEGVRVFRHHYKQHLLDTTVPYGNIAEILHELARRGRRMAIVSNKPEDATVALVDALGLTPCFVAVLGGDSLPVRKPSPEPLLHALALCRPGARPDEAVLLGDSITDLETGRAAGIPVCGVGWGFDPDGEMRRQGTDWRVETVAELGRIMVSG